MNQTAPPANSYSTSTPPNSFLRLRSRLMVLLISIFMSILVILILVIFGFVRRAETNFWQVRQAEAARNTATTIDAYLDNNRELLRGIDLLGTDELTSNSQVLNEFLQMNPEILEIIYLDETGHILANAASQKTLLGNLFTIPQSEWFRQAQTGREYYTPLQISPQDDLYIIYAVPTRKPGVLAIRFKMDVIQRVLTRNDLGEGGNSYIVDKNGYVVSHSDGSTLLSSQNISGRPEYMAVLQSENNEWYGATEDFNGRKVFCQTTAIPATGWIAINEVPKSEIFATSRLIAYLLPAGLFVLFLIAILIIRYFMGRLFLRNIESVQEGAAHLAAGDLDFRIRLNSPDEIGQLARMFNLMAEQLQLQQNSLLSMNINLEQRVEERTLNLQHEHQLVTQMEARHLALLNAIPDLIFRLNHSGEIIDYSFHDNFVTFLPQSEFIGQPLEAFFPPEARLQAREAFQKALNHSKIQTFEFECIRSDARDYYEVRVVHSGDSEVILIIQNITARKMAEIRLKASLEEKQVLLKEIHHRVKNNLQIISSLLNLQSKGITDTQIAAVFQESQNRIRAMALIHENLYQTENLASINFTEYIRNLVTSLLRSTKNSSQVIRVQYDVDEISLPLEFAVPCGLMINELVTNAIKYAFLDGRPGEITIAVHRSADHLIELTVSDNGVGFPADFDIHQTTTLGWQLIHSLAGQLDADIAVRNGNGVAIQIQFQSTEKTGEV